MDTFNNREIALIIWILIFLIWMLFKKNFWIVFKKDLRVSLFNFLKILTSKKIIILIFSMLLYVFLIIFMLHKIGFWNVSMIKDTIFWTFGVAFIMLINSDKANKDEHFFRKILLDNIKLIIVLEFIINLYVFNLVVELILIPILFIVVMMSAFAETKKENMQVKKAMGFILVIIGICFIIFVTYNIIIDFKGFASLDNLRGFLLPPVLTTFYLPFAYFMALFMIYETFFLRINILISKNKALTKYAKRKILEECHFNLRKLNIFSKKLKFCEINSENDLLLAIQEVKKNKI